DPRLPRPLLHPQAGGITAEDLIVAFSDGRDGDGNGYVDDISGWNFHRDTNEPQTDNSVYGHANGESRQAVAETDNGFLAAGMFYPHTWPGNSIVGAQSTRGQQSPSVLANRTYRSRSTLTSFGPHALFSVPNNDGSTSTGTPTQAAVAALVIAAGLDAVQAG